MPDLRYAREKLGDAVEELVGAPYINQRLLTAYMRLGPLQPGQLPDDLQEEFSRVKQALSFVPVGKVGERTLTSTLDSMSDEEAEALARTIFELFLRLCYLIEETG